MRATCFYTTTALQGYTTKRPYDEGNASERIDSIFSGSVGTANIGRVRDNYGYWFRLIGALDVRDNSNQSPEELVLGC